MSKSEPTALVYRGRMLPEAMRRERVLPAEVHAAIREPGMSTLAEADLVVLETDGTVTVVGRLLDDARSQDAVSSLLPEREGEGDRSR